MSVHGKRPEVEGAAVLTSTRPSAGYELSFRGEESEKAA
jgi:hypothetical protein